MVSKLFFNNIRQILILGSHNLFSSCHTMSGSMLCGVVLRCIVSASISPQSISKHFVQLPIPLISPHFVIQIQLPMEPPRQTRYYLMDNCINWALVIYSIFLKILILGKSHETQMSHVRINCIKITHFLEQLSKY